MHETEPRASSHVWPSLSVARSGEEGPVAGEGGEGQAPAGEPAGGPPEEAGGAAAEGREAPGTAGGEAEAEAGEEQGRAAGKPMSYFVSWRHLC